MSCRVYSPSSSFSTMGLADSTFSPRMRFTDDESGTAIIAPLPRKTLSLLAAGMPRLGTVSPAPRLPDLPKRTCSSFGLYTVEEHYDVSSESQEEDEEIDAYTELFEIIESGRTSNHRISLPVTRRRKSSVPNLFGDLLEPERACEFDTPMLSKTPRPSRIIPRPIQIQKEFAPETSMVVGSPVSRTHNPVPNNTPFRGYRHNRSVQNPSAMLARISFPSDNESDDEDVLDILSPSPISFKEDWEGRRRSKSMNAKF